MPVRHKKKAPIIGAFLYLPILFRGMPEYWSDHLGASKLQGTPTPTTLSMIARADQKAYQCHQGSASRRSEQNRFDRLILDVAHRLVGDA